MRILAAISDSGMRRRMIDMLNAEGCEVLWAGDAWAALRMVQPGGVDRVIFDFALAIDDGLSAYREIERSVGAPAIIVLIGSGQRVAGEHLKMLAGTTRLRGWLYEPFTPQDLRQAIERPAE